MLLRRPLLRPVALPVEPGAARDGGVAFALHQMHRRARKVVEAAGMIEIEVRQHDMAHVARVESQPLGLATRELSATDEAARAAIHESAAEGACRDAIQVKDSHAAHLHNACRGMWLAVIAGFTAKEGI